MGLDYSYVVAAPTSVVDNLLQEVRKHVIPEDDRRLAAVIPWIAEVDRVVEWIGDPAARDRRGIRGLRRGEYEAQNSYCLTFEFPTDAALAAYSLSDAQRKPRRAGFTPVGCVWLKLNAGEDYALFRGTAATSPMSRLFLESSSVRAVWCEIAKRSGASAVFLDLEQGDRWELIYPASRSIELPEEEDFILEDDLNVNIDTYTREVLRLSKLA